MAHQNVTGHGGTRWASPRNAGSIQSEGVRVRSENAGGGFAKTTFDLNRLPVPVVSVGSADGAGSVALYQLPEGLARIMGSTAKVTVSVETEKFADFTDATPEGTLAIGHSVAGAELSPASDFTMAAWEGPCNMTSAVSGVLAVDGTAGSPTTIYLSVVVDAADVDDDTTTEVRVSGSVTVVWATIGDDD